MDVVHDLYEHVRRRQPHLVAELLDDGSTLRVRDRPRQDEDGRGIRIDVHAVDDAIVLDWTWRLPLRPDGDAKMKRFLLEYIRDASENQGWDVPVVLLGGPRHGQRLTKRREDLVGRLMFARPERKDRPQQADLYKWHLRRTPAGEYVCRFERSLVGPEVDAFIARGVESTGAFVVIPDGA